MSLIGRIILKYQPSKYYYTETINFFFHTKSFQNQFIINELHILIYYNHVTCLNLIYNILIYYTFYDYACHIQLWN